MMEDTDQSALANDFNGHRINKLDNGNVPVEPVLSSRLAFEKSAIKSNCIPITNPIGSDCAVKCGDIRKTSDEKELDLPPKPVQSLHVKELTNGIVGHDNERVDKDDRVEFHNESKNDLHDVVDKTQSVSEGDRNGETDETARESCSMEQIYSSGCGDVEDRNPQNVQESDTNVDALTCHSSVASLHESEGNTHKIVSNDGELFQSVNDSAGSVTANTPDYAKRDRLKDCDTSNGSSIDLINSCDVIKHADDNNEERKDDKEEDRPRNEMNVDMCKDGLTGDIGTEPGEECSDNKSDRLKGGCSVYSRDVDSSLSDNGGKSQVGQDSDSKGGRHRLDHLSEKLGGGRNGVGDRSSDGDDYARLKDAESNGRSVTEEVHKSLNAAHAESATNGESAPIEDVSEECDEGGDGIMSKESDASRLNPVSEKDPLSHQSMETTGSVSLGHEDMDTGSNCGEGNDDNVKETRTKPDSNQSDPLGVSRDGQLCVSGTAGDGDRDCEDLKKSENTTKQNEKPRDVHHEILRGHVNTGSSVSAVDDSGTFPAKIKVNMNTKIMESVFLPKPPPLKRAPLSIFEDAKKTLKFANKMIELRPAVQFLYDIGLSLAKQVVYRELIETQVHKLKSGKLDDDGQKQLERLRSQSCETDEKTEHLRFKSDNKCLGCSFRSESSHVLYWHKEHPHEGTRDELYCAHCNFTTWNRLKYTQHMEARHHMQGRLFPRVCVYKCPLCQYENNSKAHFLKHSQRCSKNFNIRYNLIPSMSLHVNFSLSKGFYKGAAEKARLKAEPPPLKIAPTRATMPPSTNISLLKPNTAVQLQNRLLRPPVISSMTRFNPSMIRSQFAFQNMVRPPILLSDGKILIPQGKVMPNSQILRQVRPGQPPLVPLRFTTAALHPTTPVQRLSVARPSTLVRTLNPKAITQLQVARKVTPKQSIVNTPQTKIEKIGEYAVKNNLISCEICGGFVKDRMALRVHFHFAHKINLPLSIVEAKSQPDITCKQCGAAFWTKSGLEIHMKNTKHAAPLPIGVQIYSCFVCKQKVQYLLNHMSAVHNLTLADFVNARRCCICNMSFRQNTGLLVHLNSVHKFELATGGGSISIKNAPVGIIAPTTYSQKILKQASQCTLCKANFANNTLLTQHCLRVHVNCTRCGVVFKDRATHTTHTCKAPGENSTVVCQVCQRSFMLKRFRTHVELCHLKQCRVIVKRRSEEEIETISKRPRVDLPVLKRPVFKQRIFKVGPRRPFNKPQLPVVEREAIVIDAESNDETK